MFCYDWAKSDFGVGNKHGDDVDLTGYQPDVGSSERAVWGTLCLNSNAWVNDRHGSQCILEKGETCNRDHHHYHHCIARIDRLTEMCEHKQECDEENHPARDHFRGHKESQPGEADLGGG